MGKEKDIIRDSDGNPIISDKIQKELDEKDAFDKAQQNLQKQMDERANGKSLNEKADESYKREPPKIYGIHRDLGRRPLLIPILFGTLLLVALAIIAISLISKEPMPVSYQLDTETAGIISALSIPQI